MRVRTWIMESLPDYLVKLIRLVFAHFRRTIFFYRNAISKLKAKRIANKGGIIKIELGAHRKKTGFYMIDLNPESDLVLDLVEPIPFPDSRVDLVYCSHLLEHFYHRDLIKLLGEIFRILKPGGEFKIVVPDASIYVKGYLDSKSFDLRKYIGALNGDFNFYGNLDLVNYIAYMGGHHKFMFDAENLINILRNSGFKDVHLREFDPELDLEVRRIESIHVIAIK